MTKNTKPFSLGVIMLNTRFPRVKGDIGNPETFAFDVFYQRVETAHVDRIITSQGIDKAVKEDIFFSIKALEERGVDLIVTSCGFLGEIQAELQDYANTPILTSSLMSIPFIRTFLAPNDKIGVITFDAEKLNEKHFSGYYGADIVIQDIAKNGELYNTIKHDRLTLDTDKAQQEVVQAAQCLMQKDPSVRALVLECTNLPPYIDAIREETGLPVFDLVQAIQWFKNASS